MFRDRHHAGTELAKLLEQHRGSQTLVLGLPRGGVPVAYEVARALGAPLDVFLVRKLGVPGNEELALGAIASGGAQVFNQDIIEQLRVGSTVITSVIAHERQELQRRETLYRHGLLPLDVAGKDVVLVDDGMATGASMLVAVRALRGLGPRSITVGVPVSSSEALRLLRPHVDDWASVITPPALYGVGMWYEDFSQTSDAEVGRLLAESRHQPGVAA